MVEAKDVKRFWAKVLKTPACWLWKGAKDRYGYGLFHVGSRKDGTRRKVLAHRFAYELMVGPIPDGLEIDHKFRNRACQNPTHMELVTGAENSRRGAWATKTHCPQGHPYSGDNLYLDSHGWRYCRICRRARAKKVLVA